MCGCTNMKRRRRKTRKVSGLAQAFTVKSLGYMIAGGIASKFSNGLINTVLSKLPAPIQTATSNAYAKGGIQAAKVFLANYLQQNGYLKGDLTFAAVGFALDSGNTAVSYVASEAAPDIAAKLGLNTVAGTGDLFNDSLGSTEVIQLPITSGGELGSTDTAVFGANDEAVYGSGDMMESDVML